MVLLIRRFALLFLASLVLPGCSSLLYYPDHELYSEVSTMPIHPDSITFPSEDGTRLHAWYFPNRQKAKPKALLVFFHGNGENLSSHFLQLVYLLEHGYDFFIFDYRGYGESQGKPSPEGTVADGRAALRWAQARATTFPGPAVPLVVFGQSLGGAVAMRTLIDLRGAVPVAQVVLDSTFLSYREAGAGVLAHSFLTWIFQPFAYLFLSDAQAPGERIAEISPVPVVVIHGDRDALVGIELGRKVFAAAKEPKEFWLVPGGEHTDALLREEPEVRNRLLALLERRFGKPGPR